jgi:hypothetical protein
LQANNYIVCSQEGKLKSVTIHVDATHVKNTASKPTKLVKTAKKRKLDSTEESLDIVKIKDLETPIGKTKTTIGDAIDFPWEVQNFDQFYEILNAGNATHGEPREAKKPKIEQIDDKMIMQMEEKLMNRGEDVAENVDDFEKLLISQPNNSFYWIKYIVFYLQMAEIDKARQIAERALKTILYREENEKINVWVAYLNLENMYGTPEVLDTLFQRALQNCDSLKMYSHLAEIYARSNKTQVSNL